MKTLRTLLAAARLLSPALLAHCGAKVDDPEKSPHEASCEAICETASYCKLIDAADCGEMCTSDILVSEAGIGIIERCSASASCADLYTRKFQDCLLGGLNKLTASQAGVEKCESERTWHTRCADEADPPFDYGACLAETTRYSDDYLAQDTICLEDTCGRVANCRTRVRNLFEGDGSILLAALSGYTGGSGACCSSSNPCDYATNGICDCPSQPWDAPDCEDTAELCCAPSDPCDWADDGTCDCEGNQEWDAGDCEELECCTASDACSLAQNGTCDCNGTQTWDAIDCGEVDCCTEGNICGWENDGICDCDGEQQWDAIDCEGPATSCCHSSNPCNWDEDSFCDCNGTQAWDAVDCACCDDANSCEFENDGWCDCPWQAWDVVDCTGGDPCCSSEDSCNYGDDNVCDCAQPWDAADCTL
jgi:hypothetical protein